MPKLDGRGPIRGIGRGLGDCTPGKGVPGAGRALKADAGWIGKMRESGIKFAGDAKRLREKMNGRETPRIHF